jgi:superoxide dismutase, Fe-Mn family
MSGKTDERASETWEDEGGRTPSQAEIRARGNPQPDYYTAKRFQISDLKGISRKNVAEHLELYAGHVKYANHVVNCIKELPKDEDHACELTSLQRRLAYEHNGMRNHEVYFEQFEGGPSSCTPNGLFLKQASKDFGSWNDLVSCLKSIAMTRGIGWTMLYYCQNSGHLLPQWVDQHHIGLLSGPRLLLALDMWEHALVYDYSASEKKKYVEALFENLNWRKVETRFGKTEIAAA